jgi:hypothetical protein
VHSELLSPVQLVDGLLQGAGLTCDRVEWRAICVLHKEHRHTAVCRKAVGRAVGTAVLCGAEIKGVRETAVWSGCSLIQGVWQLNRQNCRHSNRRLRESYPVPDESTPPFSPTPGDVLKNCLSFFSRLSCFISFSAIT